MAARSVFSLGTISARASWLTTAILMLVTPFLALSFFLLVVASVVPVSIWKKSQQRGVRLTVGVFCFLAYGTALVAFGYDVWRSFVSPPPGTFVVFGHITLMGTAVAGALLLPLSAIGSIATLVQHRRNRQGLAEE